MPDYQIFISYRRAGGEYLAGRIADKLRNRGYTVFYDVESMRAGKFNNQIYAAIRSSADVLVILPEHGLDRCFDEGDWVRMEIEYAISLDKNIIPVMVPGFSFPAILPLKMESLRNYEGVTAYSEYFESMIDKICGLLSSAKPTAPGKAAPPSGAAEGVRFLQLGLYPQASAVLEKAMLTDMSDPDVYFYSAVAVLSGKRPFLADRGRIRKIEEYLSAALALQEKGLYHFFLAYIKFDYYHAKMLRTVPGYEAELDRARTLGVTDQEIKELFALLRTPRPGTF